MRAGPQGPRTLLRRLREIMAEPVTSQDRLDQIVHEIAANMVAEVCSLYVLRADGKLELFATEGLKSEAVHRSSLDVGQGLVGSIASTAKPLNLSDAQAHPAFQYLPETGEEKYNAFMGVPILRAGRTLGVLVVQNMVRRAYTEEEKEALETIAMIFAEMIASGELQTLSADEVVLDRQSSMHVTGLAFAQGIGLGRVLLHEPRVVVTNLIAEDANEEIRRLDKALNGLRSSVDNMLSRRDMAASGEHREVLEAYRMFANDRGWVRKMEEAIHNGLSAEAAVEKVQSDTRARMMRQADPYLRDRMHDFDDLAYRLLRELVGKPHGGDIADQPVKDAILVAHSMGAAELLDYDPQHIRGLVLDDGAPTSHVVIVARALGIPTVGQTNSVLSLVEASDPIVVDGDTGAVYIRPTSDVRSAYVDKVRLQAKRQEKYKALHTQEPVSKDGVRVSLLLNAGLEIDLPHLDVTHADGIGLFRTELQFMIASAFPKFEQQYEFYKSILDKAAGRTVSFRILDIGGDKLLPYFSMAQEDNPAMGWRAIRLALDRPGLFRVQVRALLRAAQNRHLRLMVPMVTNVEEAKQARELVDKEIAHAKRHGHDVPARVEYGVMIEVPSLIWQLDALFECVDFVSVGSNDLFQFHTACDRGNTKLSTRYDVLETSYLRVLKQISDAGARHGKSVTLCGEMGGNPMEALVLLGLGYRSLSMNPASFGPVKAALLEADISQLTELLTGILNDQSIVNARDMLETFAETHGIPI